MPTNDVRLDARRRLEELITKWREQERCASHFAEWNPRAAQDLKDGAEGQAYAFGEVANELEALLAAGAAGREEQNHETPQVSGLLGDAEQGIAELLGSASPDRERRVAEIRARLDAWRANCAEEGGNDDYVKIFQVHSANDIAWLLNELAAGRDVPREPDWHPIETAPTADRNIELLITMRTDDMVEHATHWRELPAAPLARSERTRLHNAEEKNDDVSRVEPGATIPPTGSTAKISNGDT